LRPRFSELGIIKRVPEEPSRRDAATPPTSRGGVPLIAAGQLFLDALRALMLACLAVRASPA
jgi:hypothetical protein